MPEFWAAKAGGDCRVLVMEPELLILDGPTTGLDPMEGGGLIKLLRKAQKDMRLSVIIATHDIDLAPLYCDRADVMEKGRGGIGGRVKIT